MQQTLHPKERIHPGGSGWTREDQRGRNSETNQSPLGVGGYTDTQATTRPGAGIDNVPMAAVLLFFTHTVLGTVLQFLFNVVVARVVTSAEQFIAAMNIFGFVMAVCGVLLVSNMLARVTPKSATTGIIVGSILSFFAGQIIFAITSRIGHPGGDSLPGLFYLSAALQSLIASASVAVAEILLTKRIAAKLERTLPGRIV